MKVLSLNFMKIGMQECYATYGNQKKLRGDF